MRVCLVTIPTGKGAEFAKLLLSQRHCACVNIIPGVQSHYLEMGEMKQAGEDLLFIKADESDIGMLHTAVVENHPYDTPEFVVLPVDMDLTDNDYARWVRSAPRM